MFTRSERSRSEEVEMATYSAGGSARIRSFARRHRAMTGVAVVVALGLTAFVLVWFQPQKLFIDQRVDEAAPETRQPAATAPDVPAAPAAPAVPAAPAAPGASETDPGPSLVASGKFRSLEHTTTGRALVQEFPDGSRVLRLEGFETSNGPDLRLYLSAGSSDASFGKEYGEDFVELGRLKGNIGDQNYAIPAGADLSRYRNTVIWCKRFSVGFGVATLDEPGGSQ
jgi:hypothetical protein